MPDRARIQPRVDAAEQDLEPRPDQVRDSLVLCCSDLLSGRPEELSFFIDHLSLNILFAMRSAFGSSIENGFGLRFFNDQCQMINDKWTYFCPPDKQGCHNPPDDVEDHHERGVKTPSSSPR